ncbi:MAG: hypothetical protein C0484_06970 [Rhodospirillum sp.]|nr:hypothetical protein [Rhodospirillum sp.]
MWSLLAPPSSQSPPSPPSSVSLPTSPNRKLSLPLPVMTLLRALPFALMAVPVRVAFSISWPGA